MNKINLYDSILNPLVTEKSTHLSGMNKVVFRINRSADKKSVKKNIEKIFKVSVEKVNTIKLKGKTKIKNGKKVGILFGPESSGLSNDEIICADYLVKIPSNKRFSSLNLSHSSIIFCFELFQHFSKKKAKYKTGYKSLVAKKSEVNKFLNFIIQGLDKKGFLQPDHKRQSMIRNINNIFHRLNLSEQEIRILLGVFSTLSDFNRKS